MEKIEARVLLVLQAARRAHRENGRMTLKEIQDGIAERFKKMYQPQIVKDALTGLVLAEMIREVRTDDSTLAQYRITERGCVTIAEVKKYASMDPLGRFAELVRPSFSPNVRQTARHNSGS